MVSVNPILPDLNELTIVNDSPIDDFNKTGAQNPSQNNCQSYELMVNGFDDYNQDDKAVIYRRSLQCPQPEISPTRLNGKYAVHDSVPAKNNPYEKVSPTSDVDPCTNTLHETLITCGSPEALGLRKPHGSL